jgi:hypothetical protein
VEEEVTESIRGRIVEEEEKMVTVKGQSWWSEWW